MRRQTPVSFEYDGHTFSDAFRTDLLVNERLVVEIKSVEELNRAHKKQLLTYLRLMELPLGLLFNFGSASFGEGAKRVVNNHTDFAASRLRVNKPHPGEGR